MKKYLVIQLARFGDLIQTKRLIKSLLAEQAEVHLLVDNSLASLAQLVYPDCIVHAITAHASGLDFPGAAEGILLKSRNVFSRLHQEKFDKIYNLNYSGMNFRLSSLFESDRVIGYRMTNGQEHVHPWADLAMRWSKDRRIGINLVDFWGCYADTPIAGERVNPHATPKGGGIGVVLAGRESRRSIPLDILAKIVSAKHAKSRGPVFLLGSSTEVGPARSLVRLLRGSTLENTVDLAGKTDWKGLIDTVAGLDTVLTPDTGTMHLAAHLGTPVEAYFLSSAWCFETGPYGMGHTIYQALTDCLPCLESQPCPYEIKCRSPFYESSFLRYLTTQNPEHCPSGLIHFTSAFDELGALYSPLAGATDHDELRRKSFRSFIMPHAKTYISNTDMAEVKTLSSRFYLERDWICK